jgi:hypothetical protein
MDLSRSVVALTSVLVLGLLAPPLSSAQSADVLSAPSPAASAAAASFDGPRQQISASPLLMMWKYFNVEYERRATAATTWGVSTSFVPGGVRYRNVGGFWHYYPGGRALEGFYIGARAQVHHASALLDSATVAGLGIELGRNWIVGRRTLVGIGIGATRLFGGTLEGESLTLPTFRIANVGITF